MCFINACKVGGIKKFRTLLTEGRAAEIGGAAMGRKPIMKSLNVLYDSCLQ